MKLARAALGATAALALIAGSAGAHPSDTFVDDGFLNSALEEHQTYGHGAAGGVPGRMELPTGREEIGLKLIGKANNVPEFGDLGRVADVSAKGNFAYLTMYYEPECGRGGVQIVDISDPANPQKRGYIPSHTDTFSGEGSQVVTINGRDVLIYQNEWCPQTSNGIGGISLVDVTDPDQPKKLVEGAGDFTKKSGAQSKGQPQTKANQTHSAFAWRSQGDGRWYVVLVDDMEELDIDILDITNPSKPVKVAEWNLDETAQTGPTRPHGDSVFSHDMVVKAIDGRDVMLMSYWDGGYVELDVTDPTRSTPTIIADTDFAAVDPAVTAATLTPEGNAHQAEFTHDNEYFFATDEDFDPFRIRALVTTGPHTGSEFTAVQAGDAKPIDDQTSVVGPTQFVGLACSAVSAAGAAKIAVIERGVCDFQVKIDNAKAAGYTSVIVFNRTGVDGCETLINMLAVTDIPAIFVSRTDGFRILGRSLDGYTCDSTSAATGTSAGAPGPGQDVSISSVFDGWGYTHMYRADPNAEGKLDEVDFYVLPESQDSGLADGYGDLSVHEVATDPDENLVYVSHYALGMRVLSYDDDGLEEVGSFVEAGGSNYWGVEVHEIAGKKYILGSDRDRGLRIFEYIPGYVGDGE